MTTNFSEIYDLFLSQIDDYEMADVSDIELEDVLLKHIQNAIPTLQDSTVDLNVIDFQNKNFGTTLSFVEKSLFAKAMKLEWVREKRYSSELMRKAIGDRDFKAVQGVTYLKEIGALERQLEEEIRKELIESSYHGEYLSGWAK